MSKDKKELGLNKEKALEYLFKREIYFNEFQGAAMYDYIREVVLSDKKRTFTKSELDLMLKKVRYS